MLEDEERGGRPRALLLSSVDIGSWQESHRREPLPGGDLPYGMGELRRSFDLAWEAARYDSSLGSRLTRTAAGAVRRLTPAYQGGLTAVRALAAHPGADVAVSAFENAGYGLASVQRALRGDRRVPHVMVICWLADDLRDFSPRRRRALGRVVSSAAALCVLSANQVPILCDGLGVDPTRLHVVPFGVDADHYSPHQVAEPPGGGGVVAVGSDSRRDYATLFRAVELSGVPVTLSCHPRNLAGLKVPERVTLVSLFGAKYRALLHSADLVVTPTVGPAYPSGQSVVLEAMAMRRPTLTTDSPAMRDYVTSGVHGALVPPRDPIALAEQMTALLDDEARRAQLADAGHERVRSEFTQARMWDAIAEVMRSASRGSAASRSRV